MSKKITIICISALLVLLGGVVFAILLVEQTTEEQGVESYHVDISPTLTSEDELSVEQKVEELMAGYIARNPDKTPSEIEDREKKIRSGLRRDALEYKELLGTKQSDVDDLKTRIREEAEVDPYTEMYMRIRRLEASREEYLKYLDIAISFFEEANERYNNGTLNKEKDIVIKFGTVYSYQEVQIQLDSLPRLKEIVKNCEVNYLTCLEEVSGEPLEPDYSDDIVSQKYLKYFQ